MAGRLGTEKQDRDLSFCHQGEWKKACLATGGNGVRSYRGDHNGADSYVVLGFEAVDVTPT